MIDTKRNLADIVLRGVKPAKLLSNRSWLSGPEFLILNKDSWPPLKVCDKFILLCEIESRGNDVMCDVICKEDEKNRDNEVCCVTSLFERMVMIVCVQFPLILKQTLKEINNFSSLVVYSNFLELRRLFISS